jgi:ATP-dependent DNA helicase RecG
VDVLVMSATPIPRSLELAQYGDMDVSALYEKPPGRKPITTAAVPLSRLADVIAKLKAAIASGRQAYWVCPLVEESETMDLTAAEERFKILRAAFGDDLVGLVMANWRRLRRTPPWQILWRVRQKSWSPPQ